MRMTAVTLCVALTLGACTTTQRVSVQQPGDRTMSCSGLRQEFTRLDGIIQDGQGDQGVNAANVASVLFFWPAAVGNYFTARDAIQVAERRREHLMAIYNSRGCDGSASSDARFPVPAYLLTPQGYGMP